MEDKVIADLKKSYGITCYQIAPVSGGLLNLKWKVSTDKGELLVKQYSTQRFRRDQIEWIESVLQRQIILEKRGFPCPCLWQNAGRVIRWMDEKTIYMVMSFCPGKTESSETVTIAQMRSLGSACAAMHKMFAQLPEPSDKSLPGFGGYTMDQLRESFESRMMQCTQDTPVEYRKALLALEPVLKRLNTGFFGHFPKGFAHEDFQPGNILFHGDRVSAIVDFDRNCYSYIWHDVGRAVLSFALEGGTMNVGKVCAFREGYSQHSELSMRDVAGALRLSWCIETPWWIQPKFFEECDEIPKRFRDEMLWLTEHWFELDSLLCTGQA